MKTLALLFSITFLAITASVSAQDKFPGDKKNKSAQTELQQNHPYDENLLDRIQKETEDISMMKPLLFLASIVEARLELKRFEKESIAAAKSRESGAR